MFINTGRSSGITIAVIINHVLNRVELKKPESTEPSSKTQLCLNSAIKEGKGDSKTKRQIHLDKLFPYAEIPNTSEPDSNI